MVRKTRKNLIPEAKKFQAFHEACFAAFAALANGEDMFVAVIEKPKAEKAEAAKK
jgi:hypothetical protein